MVTWRSLIQKASHLVPKNRSDVTEVLYQILRAFEVLRMSNQLAHLNRIDEFFPVSLFNPVLNCGFCRPWIKWRVDLNRFKSLGVMRKPILCCQRFWVKDIAPVPIKPSRTTYMVGRSRRYKWLYWRRKVWGKPKHMHFSCSENIVLPLLLAADFAFFASLLFGQYRLFHRIPMLRKMSKRNTLNEFTPFLTVNNHNSLQIEVEVTEKILSNWHS